MALPIGVIKQSQVIQEVFGDTSSKSLSACFAAATGEFNNTYVGSKDRLSNFKGYNHTVFRNTPFDVGPRRTDSRNICQDRTAVTVYWHDGANDFPNGGDNVWTTENRRREASDGWYKMLGGSTEAMQVSGGVVDRKSICRTFEPRPSPGRL